MVIFQYVNDEENQAGWKFIFVYCAQNEDTVTGNLNEFSYYANNKTFYYHYFDYTSVKDNFDWSKNNKSAFISLKDDQEYNLVNVELKRYEHLTEDYVLYTNLYENPFTHMDDYYNRTILCDKFMFNKNWDYN